MTHVSGVGGLFWRADDPAALQAWYASTLGIAGPPGDVWRQEAGPTAIAPFARDSDHFGPEQQFMVNFRVRDLAGLLRHLREHGVPVLREESQDGVGEFAWIVDPEGNRIELWEPSDQGSD